MTSSARPCPENRFTCAICRNWLHDMSVFPDDFPREWKWCCGCVTIGEILIDIGIEEVEFTFSECNSILKRIERVNKMICVN